MQKFWPLIFFAGVTAVFLWAGFRWEHLFVLVPFLLMTLFGISLAVVEVSDEGIRYRRFSDWRSLSFDEITSCGFSKVRLGIGYIRLRHYLWPWGKLYFILDEPVIRGTDIVSFVRERTGDRVRRGS